MRKRGFEMIRIALTKGRIEEKTLGILERAGYDCSDVRNKGRKLLLSIGDNIEVVLSKSADVITYIEHGVCDIGIVGEDTIMEHGKTFYELLDLGFGKCRFALAGIKGKNFYDGYSHKVIASKYPTVTKNYFNSRGIDVEVVKIEGSVELAPLLGLADAIVDIVETGSTLKENGLEVYEEIANVSARLIVNVASIKLKRAEISEFIDRISAQIEK
ncbi:MAG: ATP phosphoribosyltransferase [Clostridia bacterium]|nr:ATP phosphoribosyltransferase [Clostridia bacterium]